MTPPTLAQVRESVGSEEWLAAFALLDLSPALAYDAEQFAGWSDGGRYRDGEFFPDAWVDWETWVADVDKRGRGWSSTEHRLFAIVAALVVDGRELPLRGVLDRMGSWELDVCRILTIWATGGNNRDLPGRATVVPS